MFHIHISDTSRIGLQGKALARVVQLARIVIFAKDLDNEAYKNLEKYDMSSPAHSGLTPSFKPLPKVTVLVGEYAPLLLCPSISPIVCASLTCSIYDLSF